MASEIVPMTVPLELDTLAIIKKMLLAPADDNDGAVARAVQELRAYYRTTVSSPDASGGVPDYPAKLVMFVVGAVVDHVFELANVVDRHDPAHKRLADLLIGLKQSGAATKFDAEACLTSSSIPIASYRRIRITNPLHVARSRTPS
jgi:hypothetical protein